MSSICISGKDLLKLLLKKWAKLIRSKWSHNFIKFWDNQTIIPMHSNQDLPIWTLLKIARDLQIDDISEFVA